MYIAQHTSPEKQFEMALIKKLASQIQEENQ